MAKSYWLRHVCLSVRSEQLGCQWADFHEILYSIIFRKSVEKIQVSLKSGKYNWNCMYCTFVFIFWANYS